MRNKFRFILPVFIIFLPCLIFAKQVRIGLHWQPQAQFAGYIMALEKGLFAESDLDVELVFTEGVDLILDKLINNEFDYATSWLSQAIYINKNEELINLCQILQHSSLMIVAKKDSDIYRISNLNNKNVSLWNGDFSLPLNAFLKKHQLKINKLPGKANIDLFMSDACDAASVMYYNEYNKIYLAGLDHDKLSIFRFSDDKELDFVEDGVYVRKDYYLKNLTEAKNIKNAILSGWFYAYHNREETVQTVLKYCNEKKLRTNYAEQKWMLDKILEAIFGKEDLYETHRKDALIPLDFLGELKETDYYQIANELKKQKIIQNIIPYKNFIAGSEND